MNIYVYIRRVSRGGARGLAPPLEIESKKKQKKTKQGFQILGPPLANSWTRACIYIYIYIYTYIYCVLHCIVRFSGVITRSQHLERFVLHLIMRIEKYLVFPRGVVPELCMLNIIFVTLKQRYGKAYMVLCRDWKTALTLLFVLCIIHVLLFLIFL